MIRNEVINKEAIGKVFIHTATSGSTNTWASEWFSTVQNDVEKAVMHGAVFVAHAQTAGRGQIGNVWYMQAGKDAAFSIILIPGLLAVTDQFYLNMAVSLAVYDALKQFTNKDLFIKWPNDIYTCNKKMGGILIENTVSGQLVSQSIVGIGLNINSEIDAGLLPKAVSLKEYTGQSFTVIDIIHKIAACLNVRYNMLQQGGYARLKEEYIKHMYKQGAWHHFTQGHHTFEAIVYGISYPGKLLLQHKDGTIIAYGFKEVVWE